MKLTTLAPLGSSKDLRLPKGVKLDDKSKDAVFVVSPKAATFQDVMSELPAPETCADYKRLFIHPEAAREDGMLAKLKPRRVVPLAIRASALLARGYAQIEAAEIEGNDWVSALTK